MTLTDDNCISAKQVLDIATRIGFCLLKYGAEINRVEDTAKRICDSYNMDNSNIFAIASSIVITVEHDGRAFTQTRRVNNVATNLDRVDKLNALSRKICAEHLSYDVVLEEIKTIESAHLYPTWVSVFAYAIIGAAFSIFFGGNLADSAVGFVTGFLIRIVMIVLERVMAPAFFINALTTAAVVFFIHIASIAWPNLHTETITIGVLMNLVPGVLLTNCMRDFLTNDFTSGVSRITEAFFVAAAIALGVAVSLLWR